MLHLCKKKKTGDDTNLENHVYIMLIYPMLIYPIMKLTIVCMCIEVSKYFCFLKLMKKAFTSSYQVIRPRPLLIRKCRILPALSFYLTWSWNIYTKYKKQKIIYSKSYLPKCSFSSSKDNLQNQTSNSWDEIQWGERATIGPSCNIMGWKAFSLEKDILKGYAKEVQFTASPQWSYLH